MVMLLYIHETTIIPIASKSGKSSGCTRNDGENGKRDPPRVERVTACDGPRRIGNLLSSAVLLSLEPEC